MEDEKLQWIKQSGGKAIDPPFVAFVPFGSDLMYYTEEYLANYTVEELQARLDNWKLYATAEKASVKQEAKRLRADLLPYIWYNRLIRFLTKQ